MLEVIKRVKVTKPTKRTLATAEETARKAEELLGYTALSQAKTAADESHALASALIELGITVLHPSTVEKYKKDCIKDANEKSRRSRWYNTFSWKQTALPKYRKAVPIEALNMAVRIAEKVPTAQFIVEELARTRTKRVVADPFLVVRAGNVRYHIAHWDEPGFEDKG